MISLKTKARDFPHVTVSEASFPDVFEPSLQFSPPARGVWNIVHNGMLIPESHQIFACARGCLRGVVLTAAEMNAIDRFSWIAMDDNDLICLDPEQRLIEGVCDIIDALKKRPRCILFFISCVQLFSGIDVEFILEKLGKKYADMDFIDCYMDPTMRKSGINVEEKMRRQMYAPLRKTAVDDRMIHICGNDRATHRDSELLKTLELSGFSIRDITTCRTYDEYLTLSKCGHVITYYPPARHAATVLSGRLGSVYTDLDFSYDTDVIEKCYKKLSDMTGASEPDRPAEEQRIEKSIKKASDAVRDTPIAIDYTATTRPLGLAALLVKNGFNVSRIYADSFSPDEKADFLYLKKNSPNTVLLPVSDPSMRFRRSFAENERIKKGCRNEKVLAIGQKAAYFEDTRHFVNIVFGGGAFGYEAVRNIFDEMTHASQVAVDTRSVISAKGFGCESCLLR